MSGCYPVFLYKPSRSRVTRLRSRSQIIKLTILHSHETALFSMLSLMSLYLPLVDLIYRIWIAGISATMASRLATTFSIEFSFVLKNIRGVRTIIFRQAATKCCSSFFR